MPTELTSERLRHVDVMDGLRGLAIVMVILFHYWQLSFWTIPLGTTHNLEFIQYPGFLGVELFFFISGFCLYYPYANGRVPTLKHFYYRRAIKILPSYLFALVVFAFFITDVSPSTWQHGKLADLGMHLVFLQNMTPATHGSFDGVMWSLAVEVQFYVLFPAIAWFFRRQPFPTAAVMLGISVAYRAWNHHHAGNIDLGLQADYLPAFLDLFGFGMLAATIIAWIRRREEAVERLRVPMTAIAGIAVVMLLVLFKWVDSIRGEVPAGIWQSENRPYLGVLFVILAVASAFALPRWRAALSNRVLVFLSTISYNLYLWHQAIGLIIRNHDWWKADTPTPTDDPHWRWTYTLVAVTLSIIVATILTYVVERPFLHHGVRGTLRRTRDGITSLGGRRGRTATTTADEPVAAGSAPVTSS